MCKLFTEAGFMADADLDSGCLLNKKIRNAQLAQYNFILGETSSLLYYLHAHVAFTDCHNRSLIALTDYVASIPAILVDENIQIDLPSLDSVNRKAGVVA